MMSPIKELTPINIFSRECQYHLTEENAEWVSDLLDELNEHVEEKAINEHKNDIGMTINLNISRENNNSYKDHVMIEGDLTTNYVIPCVRCLEPMVDTLTIEFSGCFLPDEFEKDPGYEEVDSIFCKNKEMHLYFHTDRRINMKEYIHEQIYLSYNHTPIHSDECKGLCQICGTNLNKEQCKHGHK